VTPTTLPPTTRIGPRIVSAIVGGTIVVAALAGCSDDTTPQAGDVASNAAVARELDRQRTEPSAKSKPHASVTAKGANGRTYRCPFSAATRLDAADAKVKRRTNVLRGRRVALRKLQRRYPGGTAPSAVVDRYEFLRARYNAQVRLTNRAIRAYNRLLRQVCHPQ
jgi:hypothetical protein